MDVNEFFFPNENFQTQIGLSACGPTALLNVCIALKQEHNNQITDPIFQARTRDYDAKSLYTYLLSRIRAGTIHTDLIKQIQFLTNNQVTGQTCDLFIQKKGKFVTFDSRKPSTELRDFIIKLMKLNCVPILTENLFLVGNDAWHHQMAYGADQNYIYLTNPEEKVTWQQAQNWVTSQSWMIIPTGQLYNRKLNEEEIKILKTEQAWAEFGVYNQLGAIIQNPTNKIYQGLTIPWGGMAGITFFFKQKNQDAQNFFQQFEEKTIKLPFYPEFNTKYFQL